MSGGVWRPTTVVRFIKAIPTSTNVVRVDTDAGEGFLKALGNPEGPHVLACELVGTLLADWLGLSTLDYAIVAVTPDDEIPFVRGGSAFTGPAFITRAVEGFPWGGDVETLRQIRQPETLSQLVALDTWIRNCDRYRPAPNLRVNRDNVFLAWQAEPEPGLVLKAMDHTHAFTCGRELTSRIGHLDEIRDTAIFGRFPEFQTLLDLDHVRAASGRMGQMDRATAEQFVAQVPVEWQVAVPVREAWVRFIVDRAVFVAANLVNWLWP
jgi:hypothetical protein